MLVAVTITGRKLAGMLGILDFPDVKPHSRINIIMLTLERRVVTSPSKVGRSRTIILNINTVEISNFIYVYLFNIYWNIK
jgi:hypothetical protein